MISTFPPADVLFVPHDETLDECQCALCYSYAHCHSDRDIDNFWSYIIKYCRAQDKKNAGESVKKRLFWITVNPPPEADHDPVSFFKHVVEVLSRRKWISRAYFNIEQRSEELNGPYSGFHVHILVVSETPLKGVKRPAQAHRELYSWFLRLYPSMNKKALDLKTFPMDYFDDKMDYLKGLKDDPDKTEKVLADRQMRLTYEFPEYYTYEPANL